ncbi:unnamed protein product [Orchesella dallaii]|uniref:Uncharacterized protein n=1 Tax=Orchesella dallaii TaxID=48710 RepID=A0ABP1R4D9_9HEXA
MSNWLGVLTAVRGKSASPAVALSAVLARKTLRRVLRKMNAFHSRVVKNAVAYLASKVEGCSWWWWHYLDKGTTIPSPAVRTENWVTGSPVFLSELNPLFHAT